MLYYPYAKQSLTVTQGLFRLLCTSCSGEGDVRKSCGLRFLFVVGMVPTALLYPEKLRDVPKKGARLG